MLYVSTSRVGKSLYQEIQKDLRPALRFSFQKFDQSSRGEVFPSYQRFLVLLVICTTESIFASNHSGIYVPIETFQKMLEAILNLNRQAGNCLAVNSDLALALAEGRIRSNSRSGVLTVNIGASSKIPQRVLVLNSDDAWCVSIGHERHTESQYPWAMRTLLSLILRPRSIPAVDARKLP